MHTRTESFPAVQEVVEKFTSSLKTSTGKTLDLQPLFFRLTMDTTMAVLFGRSGASSSTQAEADETSFAESFDHAQHVLAQRGRLGDLYWLIDGLGFRQSCRAVHAYIDRIVADALAENTSSEASDASKERYVFLKTLIENTRDPKVLRDQCINVLLAGRDTTACLLSWTT
jgi:cytochrome P450